MAEYQHTADAIAGNAYSGVIRVADGRWIANAAGSQDWAAYTTWALTNMADPFLCPADGGAVITLQPGEEAVGAMLPSMEGAQWPAVPVSSPVNVDVPAITGTPTVGATLTVTMGNWQHEPTGYSPQWLRDNVVLVSTAKDYVVQPADVGHALTCVVTAENALGFTTAPPSVAVYVTEGATAGRVAARAPAAPSATEPMVPRQPTTRSEPPPPKK